MLPKPKTPCKVRFLIPTNKEQQICHALATTSAFNLNLCHIQKIFKLYAPLVNTVIGLSFSWGIRLFDIFGNIIKKS